MINVRGHNIKRSSVGNHLKEEVGSYASIFGGLFAQHTPMYEIGCLAHYKISILS